MTAMTMNQPAKTAPSPPPFSVLGGFLGAGKTTLLNRLLADPCAPRCAVLVNDFGDIAVDAKLIGARGGDTIAMQNGCVCCSIGGDLARGIATALDLRPHPDCIVVEASGVAMPDRIAQVARVSKELAPGGVFVVADAGALRAQLQDAWIADTVAAQLRAADHILVSKLDAQTPNEQAAVIEKLATAHPAAALSTTDDVAWTDLLAVAEAAATVDAGAGATVDDGAGVTVDAGAPGAAPHARFVARTLRADAPVDLRRLAAWLERHPEVYRLKGWAVDHLDGRLKLLQATGARLAVTAADHAGIDGLLAIVIGGPDLPPAPSILRALGVLKPASETRPE